MAADLDASASMLDVLRDLHHDIDRLHELDLTALADAELVESLRETERAIRRLPAARNAAAAEVKSRGLAGQHGCRSNQAFLRLLLGWSAAEAGSCLAQADDLVGGRSLSTGEKRDTRPKPRRARPRRPVPLDGLPGRAGHGQAPVREWPQDHNAPRRHQASGPDGVVVYTYELRREKEQTGDGAGAAHTT
jgi:hypothetical protein